MMSLLFAPCIVVCDPLKQFSKGHICRSFPEWDVKQLFRRSRLNLRMRLGVRRVLME